MNIDSPKERAAALIQHALALRRRYRPAAAFDKLQNKIWLEEVLFFLFVDGFQIAYRLGFLCL
jgi:hypothetical protein